LNRIIGLGLCLTFAGSAFAGGAVAGRTGAAAKDSIQLLPSPITLPKRIGPMSFVGEPHQYDDPRLGVWYQYSGPGSSLTVYIYDAGQSGLQDGADTGPVCREFELAKRGVEQAYQKTHLVSQQLARLDPPADAPLIREALYEYEREQHPTLSFIWITTAAKYFLKLRLSMDPRLRDELPDARRGLLMIVGDAIKPYLETVAPTVAPIAKPAGTSLTLDAAAGSDDAGAAALEYLVLLNDLAMRSPEHAPVCGGEFVPDLQTDAGLYRELFALDAASGKSRLGKRLSQIDRTGFLEEYLWVDRHRDAWGKTPPPDLSIPEYLAWKKRYLRRFELPAFGKVIIDHPRPLPLESPAGL
jgi:hypothetical protein